MEKTSVSISHLGIGQTWYIRLSVALPKYMKGLASRNFAQVEVADSQRTYQDMKNPRLVSILSSS